MSLTKKIAIVISTLALSLAMLLLLGGCKDTDTCNHIYGSWTVKSTATCTAVGEQVRLCEKCGAAESGEIEALGHRFIKYTFDNNKTCTSMGTKTAACERSGCSATDSTLMDGNPVGHTYKNGECTACADKMTSIKSYDASVLKDGSITATVYEASDGHYELDFIGNGDIADFSSESAPEWDEYSELITVVHLYEGITAIGDYAFANLKNVTNVFIEKGLKRVGSNAFVKGFSPSRVYIYDIATWVSLEFEDEGIPSLYLNGFIYYNNNVLQELFIDEGIKKINPYAFYDSSSILTVSFSADLEEIGEYAFYSCGAIDEVHIVSLEDWCKVKIAREYANPLTYAEDLYIDQQYTTVLEIPDTVTEIAPSTFEGCVSIKSVVFSASTKSVGEYAFYGCTGIDEIHFEGVEEIGAWAFYGCTALKELEIGSAVKIIGADAFRGCNALQSVSVPEDTQLSDIGNHAFDSCTALVSLSYGKTATEWESVTLGEGALPEDVAITFKE